MLNMVCFGIYHSSPICFCVHCPFSAEAIGYLWIGVASAVLFGVTVVRLAMTEGVQAGHIYAVMTYLWSFAMSLDDAPRLIEQFSNLRDIGKRVEVS
ncbi:integral membrane protein [Rodentibacter pneumotropicus]|uniref:Integral membrane protein n=1 Tax=Rodentibacter pneumotropicus TaxID=758 RepID=A0A448MPH8_9PAST|nr:hypothetical protein [Rodentibacter pneumotropicus]VEH67041.1 integral membrane protein [Rodentibacter pneumotropicus]